MSGFVKAGLKHAPPALATPHRLQKEGGSQAPACLSHDLTTDTQERDCSGRTSPHS